MGFRGNMIRFINSFLTDRFIKVKVGTTLSSPLELEDRNMFCNCYQQYCCIGICPFRGSLFVDDFAMYVTRYDAVSACRYLQKSIDAISAWADYNGFKFSSSKTVAVQFTRCTRRETIPHLEMKDSIIPYEKKVKFLGMILDNKLTWSSHIDSLKI